MNNGHDQILSKIDDRHYISLCEYGLVHVEWGRHSLVYCPGDLIGLSYQLTALSANCAPECIQNSGCSLDRETGTVLLPYGSAQIHLTIEECQQLHLATQKASHRLWEMRKQGYFSNQKWLPPKQQKYAATPSRPIRLNPRQNWPTQAIHEAKKS